MSRMVARAARVPEAVSVIEASVGHGSGRVKAAKSLTLLTRSVNRYRNIFGNDREGEHMNRLRRRFAALTLLCSAGLLLAASATTQAKTLTGGAPASTA